MVAPMRWLIVASLLAGTSCGGGAGAPTVAWFDTETDSLDGTMQLTTDPLLGHAISVADVDGDGRPELFIGRGRADAVLLSCPSAGSCHDRTEGAGLAGVEASAAAFVDANDDGDLDLFVATPRALRLFVGDGLGTFVERLDIGLDAVVPVQPAHVLPFDVDDDGRLDLYVSDYGAPNLLLRARPGGGYDEVAATLGLAGESRSLVASLIDVDDDGAPDLFVGADALVDDFGDLPEYSESRRSELSDRLYERGLGPGSETVHTDVTPSTHLDVPRSTMGALVVDVNRDSHFDLFLSDLGRNHLALGTSGLLFEYGTAAAGLDGALHEQGRCPGAEREDDCLRVSWGAVHRDFDGDGLEDLFVANGGLDLEREPLQPVGAFAGAAGARFVTVDPRVGGLNARAVVDTDLDGDGDVDLLVSQYGASVLRLRGLRRPRASLRVTLEGTVSNAAGAGATVTARLDDGTRRRVAYGAGGVLQVSRRGAWFDVDPVRVTTLEVVWPSGLESAMSGPFESPVVIREPLVVSFSREVVAVGAGQTVEVTLHAPVSDIEPSAGTFGPFTPEGDDGFRTTYTPPAEGGLVSFALLVDSTALRARPTVLVTR